jgi:signal transduction histidine kinase
MFDLQTPQTEAAQNRSPKDPQQELQSLRDQVELAKHDLERLERIKPLASLASSVVHDVRNCLGVISSTAQFVLDKFQPAEREKQAWELVQRNVLNIQKILNSYLGLARQTEGNRERHNLNDSIGRVAHFLEVQARNRNIQLEKNLQADLSAVTIDVSAVESSILNISINALEAMERNGKITYSTKNDPQSKTVCLEIADTGPGIPPELIEKIFQPFFTTKPGGTGVGLYSAKSIVEQNQGQLGVQSKVGSGTTLSMTFPMEIRPA